MSPETFVYKDVTYVRYNVNGSTSEYLKGCLKCHGTGEVYSNPYNPPEQCECGPDYGPDLIPSKQGTSCPRKFWIPLGGKE